MADTLSSVDSNTQAQSSSSHTLRPPLLTASRSLSLKSSPDVSFPFRGQRKLNQICPQGSFFDGEIGEESGEEPGGGAGEDHPAPLPLPRAFTPQWAVGQRPPPRVLCEGRARQQVPKKLLWVEAAFVEGRPRPPPSPPRSPGWFERIRAPPPASLRFPALLELLKASGRGGGRPSRGSTPLPDSGGPGGWDAGSRALGSYLPAPRLGRSH